MSQQNFSLSPESSVFQFLPTHYPSNSPIFNTKAITVKSEIDSNLVKVVIPHIEYDKKKLIHIAIVEKQHLIENK